MMTVPISETGLPLIVLAESVPNGAKAEGKTSPQPRRARVVPFHVLISLITIAAAIGLWWGASALKLVPALFLPAPDVVLTRLVSIARDGFVDATLLQHLGASLGRVFAALGVALVIGVPVGLAIALSTVGRGILDPVIEFLRPIPPLAYLPLVVIWAGIGETAKVLVITLAMVPPIVLSTVAGAREVAVDRLNVARALGATRAQLVRLVILPSAVPSILTGTRIALGAGWSTLVAAELVAATRGVGFMIQSAANFLATDVVIAGILVIAGVAFALEFAIRLIERFLVPWTSHP